MVNELPKKNIYPAEIILKVFILHLHSKKYYQVQNLIIHFLHKFTNSNNDLIQLKLNHIQHQIYKKENQIYDQHHTN